MVAGQLEVEWLGNSGVTRECLEADASRWIPPGTRWRVAHTDAQTRFQLEIHADDSTAAAAPQVLRAALLDEAEDVPLADALALERLLAALAPGAHCVARGNFDFTEPLRAAMAASADTLCWHPLDSGPQRCTALIVRSAGPVGLLEYLGRDHAVIEAALAGALRGNVERELWLRNSLARHLVIEEQLLFPAYLRTGGRVGWVRGLCNEHKQLRHHLGQLFEPLSQRRFLLLLDGHDEKEEQIVYPDILARLGDQADSLSDAVMHQGPVSFAQAQAQEHACEPLPEAANHP